MKKNELIQKLNEGCQVVLKGNFSDGQDCWNYEYWQYKNEYYNCSYDGEYSHHFNAEDLEYAFNPDEAEDIEVI